MKYEETAELAITLKKIGESKLAEEMLSYTDQWKDEKTRGDIPDLDEHREKILKEFT